MLDVYEFDSLIGDSARVAALAVVTDTTARAIHAVLEGRSDALGRSTMVAVSELIASLTTLRDHPGTRSGKESGEVIKSQSITSGVGRLIGDDDDSRTGEPGEARLLELSRAVHIDAAGHLAVSDRDSALRLADMLDRMGRELTTRSSKLYAESNRAVHK